MAASLPVRSVIAALLLAAAGGGFVQARQPVEPAPAPEPPPPVQPPPPLPGPPLSETIPIPDPTVPAETPFVPETPAVEAVEAPEKKAAAPIKPAEPMKRGRSPTAILQALDKVTAETLRFEAPIGRAVRYKTLVFTVRACETAAPDEVAPEASAYVIIDSQPKAQPGRTTPPGRQVFRGWMFASSPGLNPMQHPVYDAWLIACKTAAPSPVKR